jgi:hypothetical protein
VAVFKQKKILYISNALELTELGFVFCNRFCKLHLYD